MFYRIQNETPCFTYNSLEMWRDSSMVLHAYQATQGHALPCAHAKCHDKCCDRDMLRAHNALLHVYASHGQVEKAVQLYTSMQERGPAIDAVSASTIIAAYAKVPTPSA